MPGELPGVLARVEVAQHLARCGLQQLDGRAACLAELVGRRRQVSAGIEAVHAPTVVQLADRLRHWQPDRRDQTGRGWRVDAFVVQHPHHRRGRQHPRRRHRLDQPSRRRVRRHECSSQRVVEPGAEHPVEIGPRQAAHVGELATIASARSGASAAIAIS